MITVTGKMGSSPTLFVVCTIIIATMLNNNGGKNGHGLKTLRAKQKTFNFKYFTNEKNAQFEMMGCVCTIS